MNADERETVVNASDGVDIVTIWTAQARHITRLRKDDAFTETRSGHHDGTEWAIFTIPAADWSPAGVRRKRKLSPEKRAAAAERLRVARDAHNVTANSSADGTQS